MSERKITFPVVGKQHGETIRRNAETGIEIHSSKLDRGGMEHTVYLPDREQGLVMWEYFGELSNARDEATGCAETMRAVIADRYDEAAQTLLADIDATVEDCGPLWGTSTVLRETIAAARRSAEAGFAGAAASRLNRAHNMMNGTEPLPADAEVAAALAAAQDAYGVGQVVTDMVIDAEATVARPPFVEAETGRVIVPLTYGDLGSASRYVEDVKLPETGAGLTEYARKQFPTVAAMIDTEPVFVRRTVGIGQVWRTDAGVEVSKFPGEAFVVSIPVNGKHAEVVEVVGEAPTYDRAHLLAVRTVARMTSLIAAAEREAYAITDADKVYTQAQAIRDAIPAAVRRGEVLTEIGRSMTSLRPADALRHAERARDLAAPAAPVAAPDADNEKVFMFGLLRTATGNPDMISAWAARHGLTSDTWTVEALYAAHEADHAEALADNS